MSLINYLKKHKMLSYKVSNCTMELNITEHDLRSKIETKQNILSAVLGILPEGSKTAR